MPTLNDVASRCGVSTATVSAVVNGADWVSRPTRERVEAAIEEVGYRPNRIARSLKTGRGYGVGVIVHDLTNPFFTEIVRSLSHTLRKLGRTLVLCDSDRQFEVGARNLEMLLEKQIDGLVLINDAVSEDDLHTHLRELSFELPVVAVDRTYDRPGGVHHLLVDSEEGAFQATAHLIAQGRRRVALISGPLGSTDGNADPPPTGYGRQARYEGYRRALDEADLPFDPALVAEGNLRYDGGRRACQQLLALPGGPPDAIFAVNDLMALGALQAAQDAGLSVPDDLAIVGFDDIPPAARASPALTTIAMPKRALGHAAAELLHERIERAQDGHADDDEPVRRLFSAHLVARGSSQQHPAPVDGEATVA